MKRRVLIVSQVIPQWYVDTLSAALGDETHIDIITGSSVKGNVIPSPKHDPRSLKSRLICWARHYLFVRSWMRRNRDAKYDMIFAVSNPPVNSAIGLMLKKAFKAPFVYMNWDLYPQVIQTSIGNPAVQLVCRLWDQWNSRRYPKIDRMLTIGEVMAASMTEPLKQKIPVDVCPIAVDTRRLKPVPKESNAFCQEHGLCDKFVVLYSGKMGLGHNIEVILEAAELLKAEREIKFVFIGDGPKYETVSSFIRERGSRNILLLPFQPEEVFPLSMACGDVGVVSQEERMAHLFMPSKAYSMMSCGQAIIGICTEHDDLHALISRDKIGHAITDCTPEKLAESIVRLYQNADERRLYQHNARVAAQEKFDLAVIKEQYARIFAETMKQ